MKRVVLISLIVLLPGAPAMASDAPGRVVDSFFAAYSRGAVDEMLSIYSPEAVFEDVNQRHRFEGTESLRGFLAGLVEVHGRMEVHEKRRIVQGDLVAVEYEYRGELDGVELSRISGKQCQSLEYSLPATTWFTVRDGRIVHQKDFIDLATFLELKQQVAAGAAGTGDAP